MTPSATIAAPHAAAREHDEPSGLPMPQRLGAIVSISAGSILYTMDANVASVALPRISHALGIGPSQAVMLVSGYNLALAVTLLPLAAIGDRFGHRRVFRAGLVAYLVAALACFMAGTFVQLMLARGLQAIAAAALLSVSLGMVRMIYPARMLGRGLGLNTMMASLGAAVAPVVGGFLIGSLSWHWVFTAGVPLALLSLATAGALPTLPLTTQPYDKLGAVLCGLTFGLLILGCQGFGEGLPKAMTWGLLVAGALTTTLFVRHERTVSLPVLPIDLLAKPALALSVAAALLAVLASTTLMLFVPFKLTAMGLEPETIGALIAAYAGAIIVAGPASGMLSDRYSPQKLGVVGLTLGIVGVLAMAWLPTQASYADIAWRIALCGVGFSMFFSPNGRLMVAAAPRNRVAGASSLLSTTRMFGQALGSALLGGLLTLHWASNAPAFAAACLAVLALACAAARMGAPNPAS